MNRDLIFVNFKIDENSKKLFDIHSKPLVIHAIGIGKCGRKYAISKCGNAGSRDNQSEYNTWKEFILDIANNDRYGFIKLNPLSAGESQETYTVVKSHHRINCLEVAKLYEP